MMSSFPFNFFSSSSSSPRTEIEKFDIFQKEAFKSISAGLDLDAKNGNISTILQLYNLGLKDLESGLGLKLDSDDLQVLETIKTQREKMEKTRINLLERMEILKEKKEKESLIFDDNTTTALISPTKKPVPSKELPSIPPPPSTVSSSTQLPSSATIQSCKRQSSTSTLPNQRPSKAIARSKESDALAHQILDEIMVEKPNVSWDSIVGLEKAKKSLYEIVVLPYMRPELFTGLREPARGVLLFGPPGTGKTMLAKAVATESNARFFAISASTLTSKNYGDGEKLVRALFAMARELQPSIIFIDEIDSILTERSDSEHEASRRLKTEFLLQFDGIGSDSNDRILLLAATNRPQEIDQAALRRLVKRIYIPLPEKSTRMALLGHLLETTKSSISQSELDFLAHDLDGYSSSDITALAKEASMGPIRGLGDRLLTTREESIRPVSLRDFKEAMKIIRPSVSPSYITVMEQWNIEKGIRS